MLSGLEARSAVCRGVERAVSLVRPTLGPLARTVAIAGEVPGRAPEVLDDAALILRRVLALPDPYESMGVMLVRQALWRLRESVGDGTATAAVLLGALVRAGQRHLQAGHQAPTLRRGMERAMELALQALAAQARPVGDRASLRGLALAAGGDQELAELLAEAFDVVTADGCIRVESGQRRSWEREYVEGAHWSEGYFSPFFVADGAAGEARLVEPDVLLAGDPLEEAGALTPLLERFLQAGRRTLLVVAPQVSGSALALLLANHQAGRLQALAVRAPTPAGERWAILEDLACLTGGRVLQGGESPSALSLGDLGRARLAWATAVQWGLVGGQAQPERLRARVQALRSQLARAGGAEEQERLRERLGKLTGGMVILRSGGATPSEAAFRRSLAAKVLAAVRSGLRGGVVPGAGSALLASLGDRMELPGGEAVGAAVVARALEEPLRVIASNAGWEGSWAAARTRLAPPGWGLDVRQGTVADLRAAGVIDALPVLEQALRVAVSAAGMVLSLEALVHPREPRVAREP